MLMLKKYSINNFFNSISIAVVALLGATVAVNVVVFPFITFTLVFKMIT